MEQLVNDLKSVVTGCANRIKDIPDAEFEFKSHPKKWSRKELVGHLIDSAQNNLRRFIVSQYESNIPHVVYDQDFWVAANNYQEMKKEEVILLWKLMNERICSVLISMPADKYTSECNTGKEQVELHNLKWLADDYVKHMKYHLNQILPGSFTGITY